MRPTTHGEKSNGRFRFVSYRTTEQKPLAVKFVQQVRTSTPLPVSAVDLAALTETTVWQLLLQAREKAVTPADPELCHIRCYLILKYKPYADAIGKTYYATMPQYSLAAIDDIKQSAMIGLCQSVDRYQLGKGTTFPQFAYGRIRGAIIDCLRNLQDYPRIVAAVRRNYRNALKALAHELGKIPNDSDIEKYLGAQAYKELSDPLVSTGVYNQFTVVDNGESCDGLDNINDRKPKKSRRSHQRSLEHEDLLLCAISNPDIRFAIFAKFWLGWKLSEIAASLNCSQSTVHNRIAQGKKIIRSSFSLQQLQDILEDEP